jgi:hypothetical protein
MTTGLMPFPMQYFIMTFMAVFMSFTFLTCHIRLDFLFISTFFDKVLHNKQPKLSMISGKWQNPTEFWDNR